MAMNAIDPQAIIAGQRRALAKAITLAESQRPEDREASQTLLNAVLPHTGNSIRVGITGVPGVGKSTFIEAFGLHLLARGHRVAVLAVDPSSPIAGGSLLGDKTRMEQLSRQDNAFIRPSPAGSALGGGRAENPRVHVALRGGWLRRDSCGDGGGGSIRTSGSGNGRFFLGVNAAWGG